MPRPLRSILASLFAGAALAPLALAAPSVGQAMTAASPKLVLAGSQFGRVLFNSNRRALYAFTRDVHGRSTCTGKCAAKWPPYVVHGKVAAGPGVRASLITTTRRGDGRLQLVYAGHPLYFYVGDPKGKLLCGNVKEFGGLWLAVAASGTPVK